MYGKLIAAVAVLVLAGFTPSTMLISDAIRDNGNNVRASCQHEQARVKTGGYQAIFLYNNQNYIGKLKVDCREDTYVLSDVFYYTGKTNQLTPLTSSTLGPEGTITVKMGPGVLWENLRAKGSAAQGIRLYKQTHGG